MAWLTRIKDSLLKKIKKKEIIFSINRITSFLKYLISSDANDVSILMNKLSEK